MLLPARSCFLPQSVAGLLSAGTELLGAQQRCLCASPMVCSTRLGKTVLLQCLDNTCYLKVTLGLTTAAAPLGFLTPPQPLHRWQQRWERRDRKRRPKRRCCSTSLCQRRPVRDQEPSGPVRDAVPPLLE